MKSDNDLILAKLSHIESKLAVIDAKLDLTTSRSSGSLEVISVESAINLNKDVDLKKDSPHVLGVPGPDFGSYTSRFEGSLEWWCDMFHTCSAKFNGRVWLVNEKTGDIPTWNLIETTCTNGHVPGFDLSNGQYLTTVKNATACSFGWRTRDGKHDKATVWAKFYCNYGSIVWRAYYG